MQSNKTNRAQGDRLRRLVMIAMFTALSYVAMLFIHIKVGFLTMDVKDAVITLCGLFFGPLSAVLISVLVPLLELITMSDTGIYGLIMNILGSVAFSLTVSLFYKWKRTLWGAVAGLVSGAVMMTAVMMLANLFITPYYMGTTMEAVRGMIPTLLLPFNFLKGVINVGAVLLLYKPLSRALHRMGLVPDRKPRIPSETEPVEREQYLPNGENPTLDRKRKRLTGILVTAVAVALIAASLVLIFTVLGGKFDFGLS